MSCLSPTTRAWSGKDARHEFRATRLLHTLRIRVRKKKRSLRRNFKKNKRLLVVCILFNHFIRATRVFSIEWKSHKPIFYLTSVTTDHSWITVGFSLSAEIEIESSIQSYREFLQISRTCIALETVTSTGRSRSLARRLSCLRIAFWIAKMEKTCGSSRGLSGLVRLSECNDEVKHFGVLRSRLLMAKKSARATTKKSVSAKLTKFLSKVGRATPRKWKYVHANFCYNWFDDCHVTHFFLVN